MKGSKHLRPDGIHSDFLKEPRGELYVLIKSLLQIFLDYKENEGREEKSDELHTYM